MLLGGERHAEIDRQPAALVLGAEPVDRQVHADLADAGLAHQQAAGVVEPLEAAGELALRQPHADRLAETGRAFEPVGANAGKALPALPLLEATLHGRR